MAVDVTERTAGKASFARWVARVGGIVLLLVGIWGFFTPDPLGINFQLTVPHNWVHILTALVLLYVGFAPVALGALANTMKVLGVIYAALFVIGLFVYEIAGVILTMPGNVLHLILAGVFLWAGFMPAPAGREVRARRPTV